MNMLAWQENTSTKRQVFNKNNRRIIHDSAVFLYSVTVSLFVFVFNLTNEYCIAPDDVDVFPAYSDPFSSSADSPIFRSAHYNQSYNTPAAGINFDVADGTEPASIGFVYNFLTSQFCYATVHSITP